MTKFVFTGDYQTHVSLPDESVVLVDPGELVELDFDDPGPLWAGPRTNVGKAAAKAAEADLAAKDAAAAALVAEEEAAAQAAAELETTAPEENA